MTLVEEAISANKYHMNRTAQLIIESALTNGPGAQIGVLGLSFKAGTDDVLESPALAIIKLVSEHFENIVAFDPLANVNEDDFFRRVSSAAEAINGSHIVAILTEWPEFTQIPVGDFSSNMNGNIIVDTRYLLNADDFALVGLNVRTLGR